VGFSDGTRRKLLLNASLVNLYFAHGDRDRLVPVRFDRESRDALKKAGIPHTYREIKGGSHLLPEVLAAGSGDFEKAVVIRELFESLKGKKRMDLSKPFSFTALETPACARYLRLDEGLGRAARVRAESGREGFVIECEGLKRITLLLDGITHGTTGRVRVTLNGKLVFDGRPRTSMEAVVRSWRDLRDRKRVFVCELALEVPEESEEEGF
jgi:hypothetical protein